MPTLFIAATLPLHAAAYWLWTRRVVPAEVRLNDRDISANGAADDLRKGYHSRRSWVRFWWWLGLTVAGNLPLLAAAAVQAVQVHQKSAGGAGSAGAMWGAAALGFAALGILLAAYFARYFTPLLNLARVASGRPDLSEWHASFDSASWPDAAVVKQVRAWPAPGADAAEVAANRQWYANRLLKQLLTRVWLWGRLLYAVLLLTAALVSVSGT